MAFVDPFLLVVTLIMTILLVVANVYFVAHYAHYADKAFASSTACKVLVVSQYSYCNKTNLFISVDSRIHHCGESDADSALGCGQFQRKFQRRHEDILVYNLHGCCSLHDYNTPTCSFLL